MVKSIPMLCPKCGSRQNDGLKCRHCGVIFDRLHKTDFATDSNQKTKKTTGGFVRFFRISCLASLAVLVIAVILILRTPSPPKIEITPDAAQKAEAKVQEFQSSIRQGRSVALQMDESELNGWLNANLAINRRHGSAPPRPEDLGAADPLTSSELEQAQATVRDVKAELVDDSVKLYATFDFHGKNMLLEIDGRVSVQDGYLRLEPTGGKMGALPLPSAALQTVIDRIFNSPQNKEKFKLPPEIQDIRIEGGKLNVTSQ